MPDIETHLVEVTSLHGPLGVKGIAEAVMTPTAPPIVNAISRVVRQRIREMASVFAAVGDRVFLSGGSLPGTEYDNTKIQLDHWKNGIVRPGRAKLVLKTSDIPQAPAPGGIPGCILAIEGGDALAGHPDRVDEFYRQGVRMITLTHFSNNELGDCMQRLGSLASRPRNTGLRAAGRRVVGRMQELGMVVDVAHADSLTLKQIGAVTRRPVVDSHGNPCSPADTGHCGNVGCAESHPGDVSDPKALFSDAQTHDVGTGRVGVKGSRSTPGKVYNLKALEAGEDPYGEESDTPIIGLDLVKEFDTPTLRDIYASGTYFHDGSARTLMDTINNSVNDKDMHGRTSHLSAQEMQDLIEFMKAL